MVTSLCHRLRLLGGWAGGRRRSGAWRAGWGQRPRRGRGGEREEGAGESGEAVSGTAAGARGPPSPPPARRPAPPPRPAPDGGDRASPSSSSAASSSERGERALERRGLPEVGAARGAAQPARTRRGVGRGASTRSPEGPLGPPVPRHPGPARSPLTFGLLPRHTGVGGGRRGELDAWEGGSPLLQPPAPPPASLTPHTLAPPRLTSCCDLRTAENTRRELRARGRGQGPGLLGARGRGWGPGLLV